MPPPPRFGPFLRRLSPFSIIMDLFFFLQNKYKLYLDFFAPNSLSLTGLFCLICKLRLEIHLCFDKMASNTHIKSDLGHFLVNPHIFVIYWSILVNLTEKIDLNPEKFRKYQCPKMVSNRLYGHYLRSYEQL